MASDVLISFIHDGVVAFSFLKINKFDIYTSGMRIVKYVCLQLLSLGRLIKAIN